MAYELGAIWLQVIPSFDGVQAQAGKEGYASGLAYYKGFDEAADQHKAKRQAAARKDGADEGRAQAEGRAGALSAAQQREVASKRRHEERINLESRKANAQRKAAKATHDQALEAEQSKHANKMARLEAEKATKMAVADQAGHQARRTAEAKHNSEVERERVAHANKMVALGVGASTARQAQEAAQQKSLTDIAAKGQQAREVAELKHHLKVGVIDEAASRRRAMNQRKLQQTLLTRALADPAGFNRAMQEVLTKVAEDGNLDATIMLDANSTKADAELAKLQMKLAAMRHQEIGVDVNAGTAVANLVALKAQLEAMERDDLDIRVDVHLASAIAQLQTLDAATRKAERGQQRLAVASTTSAGATAMSANAFRAMNGMLLATVTLGPVVIATLLGIAGALMAIVTFAGAALLGVGMLALGFGGIGDAVGQLGAVEDTQRDIDREPAAGGKKAAKSRKDTGPTERQKRSERRRKERAARNVRDARAGVGSAREDAEEGVTQARARAAKARRDVTDAEKGLARAREDAADKVERAAENQVRAEENLTEAQERAKRSRRDLGDAEDALVRAREDAVLRVERAIENQTRAEDRLRESQERAKKAQEALTEARREARREIEDMENALISSAMSERDALYNLEEARYDLFRTQQDGSATQREKDRAQLSYDIQEQQYKELQLSNKRLKEDHADVADEGVEGSERVVNAKQAIVDADKAIIDAHKSIKDAARDRERAEVDAARSVENAERRVVDARRNIVKADKAVLDAHKDIKRAAKDRERAEVDAARSVEDAQRKLSDSRLAISEADKGIEKARVEGAEKIRDAQEKLSDALRDQKDGLLGYEESLRDAAAGAGLAGTNIDKMADAMYGLQDAMDKLSPAGQDFARFLHSLKPLLQDLRWAVQEGFLPGLQEGMEMVVDHYGPRLVDFVRVFSEGLGESMVLWAEWLTSPLVDSFFTTFGEYMLIFLDQFNRIMPSLGDGLIGIIEALLPFTAAFGEAMVTLSQGFADWAQSKEGQDAMAEFFSYLEGISPDIWNLFAVGMGALSNVLQAIAPHAEMIINEILIPMLEYIRDMDTEKLGEIIAGVGAGIVAFQTLAFAVGGLSTAARLFKDAAQIGAGVISFLGIFGIGKKGKATIEAGGKAGKLALGGRGLARGVMRFGIIGLAIGAVILGLFELYEHSESFKEFVDGIVEAITTAWTEYIWPAFKAIYNFVADVLGPIFSWLYYNIIKPVWEWIKFAIEIAWVAIQIVFKLIQVALKILGAVFSWLYDNIIKPVWDWISDKIVTTWNRHIKPALEAFGNFLSDHVAPKVEAAVAFLGRIWDRLKSLFATPIEWVIDTVINEGIIGTLNKVFEFFDIDPIGKVNVPQHIKNASSSAKSYGQGYVHMADGGILPGYSPGMDDMTFFSPDGGGLRLAGGEAIIRPEATRVLGPEFVEALNASARAEGEQGVQRFLGAGTERAYAQGGLMPGGQTPDGGAGDWIGKAGSALWGGVKWGAGKIADLATFAYEMATDPVGKLGGMVESTIAKLADFREDSVIGKVGLGVPMGLVEKSGDAIKSMLGGVTGADGVGGMAFGGHDPGGPIRGAQAHVNAAGNTVAAAVGEPGMFMQAHNRSMVGDHRTGLAIDFMASNLQKTANYLAKNAATLGVRYLAYNHRIWNPGRGWTPLGRGYGNDPGHVWHVHSSFWPKGGAAERDMTEALGNLSQAGYDPKMLARSGGAQLRDGGGTVAPGLNYILNATGENEMILNRHQLDALRSGAGGGGGNNYFDIGIDRPGASAGEIAEAFNFEMRMLRRGGAHLGV